MGVTPPSLRGAKPRPTPAVLPLHRAEDNKKARQARIGHRGHVLRAARSLEAGGFLAHKKTRPSRVPQFQSYERLPISRHSKNTQSKLLPLLFRIRRLFN
ncbi:MAG: hypothetical protein FWF77_01565 [Defluviitaleaceae bacterium]|nr:hypothetical protein [Defluviitaleaceae bacterium]